MGKGNITTALGTQGVAVATIDMPGRSMNVFSSDLMDCLESLLDSVESRGDIRAVVLTSGKPAFLAGADLDMVRGYIDRAAQAGNMDLHEMCGRLGRLFRRLETNGKPFVAALDGLVLGGGLELALACHERLATDSTSTQLGLPEVKLGLLPGAGGTQRLPRLIGTQIALELLLNGEPVGASRALELGMIDAVVPKATLLTKAQERAAALAGTRACARWDRTSWQAPDNLLDFSSEETTRAIARRLGVNDEDLTNYPAYRAILSCVAGGWSKPMDAACKWEMDCFVQLIRDRVAGNMVRSLFLNRQRATKLLPRKTPPEAPPVAVEGPRAQSVSVSLAGSRLVVVDREQLPDNGVILVTSPARALPRRFTQIAWLRGTQDRLAALGVGIGVWVSDPTTHGRVVEVCVLGDDTNAKDVAFEVARALRATPLLTFGDSLLQRLEAAESASKHLQDPAERLLATSIAAAALWSAGAVPDIGIADTAAVIADFHPAHTGGPFTYLRQHRASDLRQRAELAGRHRPELFEIPEGFDELCNAVAKPGG